MNITESPVLISLGMTWSRGANNIIRYQFLSYACITFMDFILKHQIGTLQQ